jgi:prepilin-type N-terminal cleavage/methylation domain-containing protein
MKIPQNKAFTLTEILVVMVIIALTASLLFPVLRSARKSAFVTQDTSSLQQIGVGLQLYRDDNDSAWPIFFDHAVTSKHVPKDILMSKLDPFGGYGSKGLQCSVGYKSATETTYDSIFDGATGWLKRLQKADANHGIVVSRVVGDKAFKHQQTLSNFCRSYDFAYEGLILRLNVDGSVVRRQHRFLTSEDGFPMHERALLFLDRRLEDSEY